MMITIFYKYQKRGIEKTEIKESTFVMREDDGESKIRVIEDFYIRIWLSTLEGLTEFTIKTDDGKTETFRLEDDEFENEPFSKLYFWVLLDRRKDKLEREYIEMCQSVLAARAEYVICARQKEHAS